MFDQNGAGEGVVADPIPTHPRVAERQSKNEKGDEGLFVSCEREQAATFSLLTERLCRRFNDQSSQVIRIGRRYRSWGCMFTGVTLTSAIFN